MMDAGHGPPPHLHDRVQAVVDAYLDAVDKEAPGVVEGLYLVGSTGVLNEALRIRRADRARADAKSAFIEMLSDMRLRTVPDGGSLYRTPIARRREVIAFGEMVIADAQRQFGTCAHIPLATPGELTKLHGG